MITLTSENLHQLSGSPCAGGFTKAQLELLGFSWPPQRGWLKSLIGKQITTELYESVKAAYGQKRKRKDDAIPHRETSNYGWRRAGPQRDMLCPHLPEGSEITPQAIRVAAKRWENDMIDLIFKNLPHPTFVRGGKIIQDLTTILETRADKAHVRSLT